MKNKNVISFDITKKYKTYEDLSAEDYYVANGFSAPIFESVYIDKYDNTIGVTKTGKEVLITKNK